MIPILYESTETTFASNGIGRLADCTSCTVTEERNGIYECVFQYPAAGKWFDDLQVGRIVSVIHDDTKTRQPFVIYKFEAPVNGIVTFYAHHISYELSEAVLTPFTASSVAQALSGFPSHSVPTTRFSFWTDKTTVANFGITEPKAIRSALCGEEGSILDVYGGGEYEFDKFEVNLYAHRGIDRGVTIRYGKNLIDIENSYDVSEAYNAVAPFWKGEDEVVMLPEVIIVANQQIGDLTKTIAVPLDLSDEFEEAPTVAQLRTKATSRLNSSRPWVPNHNVRVDFVAMWQTDEYKDVSALQRVSLCDTVTVFYPDINVNVTEKVIRTVYNVLAERYDEIELGEAQKSLASVISAKTEDLIADLPTKGFLDAAIAHATELITGGLGGHVVFTLNADGEPEEILIMDTDDVSTAVNVWRWNQGGLGHSHNGYQGPFSDVALTMDGKINANMITVGTLDANLIRAGVIRAVSGSSYWNLASGAMYLEGDLAIKKNYLQMNVSEIQYPAIAFSTNELYYSEEPGVEIAGIEANKTNSTVGWVMLRNTTYPFNYIKRVEDRVVTGSVSIGRFTGNSYNLDTEVIHQMSTGSIIGNFVHVYAKVDGYKHEMFDADHMSDGAKFTFGYAGDFFEYLSAAAPTQRVRMLGAVEHTSLAESTTTTFSGFAVTNSSGTMAFEVRPNKIIAVKDPKTSSAVYVLDLADDSTTKVTSSDAFFNGAKVAYDMPSSRRYKEQIKDIEDDQLDPRRLYELPVRQFTYRDGIKLPYADLKGQTVPGFIAEEVDEVYPAATVHDNTTGMVETWDERRIVPGLLALLQEQKKKIDDLEKRIEALERAVKGAV